MRVKDSWLGSTTRKRGEADREESAAKALSTHRSRAGMNRFRDSGPTQDTGPQRIRAHKRHPLPAPSGAALRLRRPRPYRNQIRRKMVPSRPAPWKSEVDSASAEQVRSARIRRKDG